MGCPSHKILETILKSSREELQQTMHKVLHSIDEVDRLSVVKKGRKKRT